jgi:hypothetical protein
MASVLRGDLLTVFPLPESATFRVAPNTGEFASTIRSASWNTAASVGKNSTPILQLRPGRRLELAHVFWMILKGAVLSAISGERMIVVPFFLLAGFLTVTKRSGLASPTGVFRNLIRLGE